MRGGGEMNVGRPLTLFADPRFRSAFRIAITFLIISYIYLYSSDWLVEAVVPVEWLFVVNVSKGFIYVTVVAVGLVFFINRALVETHAAEERFKHIFDASPDGIILATLDGVIEAANPAMSRILGWEQSELIGMTRDVLFDTGAAEVQNAIRTQRNQGELRQRLMMRRKDGTEIPIFATVGVFTLPDGQTRACCLFRELTNEERHETKYREGERLRLVGHLAGGVAHDFNNLLTVISGNTEILLDMAEEGSPQYRATNIIGMASQQAAQLIRQLLAFARRQSLDPAPFSVKDKLTELMPLLEKAVGSHVAVQLRCADDVWSAYADAAQFENAVLNLVLNSKDALRDDTTVIVEAGNVTIANGSPLADVLVEGDYVTLTVTDHGSGMPEDVLARAVEPFFTTKEAGHGIGLGLSTVFGFAKQSGGHMDIHSEPGKGTIVKILLPRPVGDHAHGASDVVRGDMVGGSERILVVEDDALVRVFLENALSQLGYKVVTVGDASEALALLGSHSSIDLLVADIVLPRGMNGRELAATLKATHPDMAVLFISGYPDQEFGTESDGSSPALKKPFQVLDLAQRIRDAIDQKAAEKVTT
tara:strand:- start:4271 stop:6043 length:1773 start_codon:yes stop_codon:yes gene_type:complete